MFIKKNILTILFFLLFIQTAKPTTWTVIHSGYWNTPSIWSTGVVPPSSSSDTFNIKFPVALQYNLSFDNGALLHIDSTGGICGHYKVTVKSGANVIKYGILELDSLYIQGGTVTCLAPGQVILTLNAFLVVTGASLHVNGCSLAVGPWFDCVQPIYSFIMNGIEETNENNSIRLFPNPSNGVIQLNYDLKENGELKIYDISGKLLSSYFLPKNKTNFSSIDLSLENGVYFYTVPSNNQKIFSNKLVIIN